MELLDITTQLDAHYSHWLYKHLLAWGLESGLAKVLNVFFLVICVAILAYLVDRFVKYVLVHTIEKIIRRTPTNLDDILINNQVFQYASHVVPALLVYRLAPAVFEYFPKFLPVIETASQLYFVVIAILVIRALLRSAGDALLTVERLRDKPIKSFVQLANVVNYSVMTIIGISILIGKSPVVLFSALGAATAILLLVFKDTILGLVSSVQLSVNDMVKTGDWITMEKYGADGEVTEINLTTIKVSNWDKTITTIPPYALVSDSFKNWRGMQESGGRRIKRALYIKMDSVKFCDEAMLEKFAQIQLVSTYLKERKQEIENYNKEKGADKHLAINGRNFTNLGVFRKYAEIYISQEPRVNTEMTFMVRQLAPSPEGIPLEVYCFSRDKLWIQHEELASDIFDHLIAAVGDFELQIFEKPTGADFQKAFTK